MRLYLDTSALAKRYVLEKGSDTVTEKCEVAGVILLSVLSPIEMASVFSRMHREKKITEKQHIELSKEFEMDLAGATLIKLDDGVIAGAIGCVERRGIATLDAIHIASAEASGCTLFLTADIRQYAAARAGGIKSELIQ